MGCMVSEEMIWEYLGNNMDNDNLKTYLGKNLRTCLAIYQYHGTMLNARDFGQF